MIRTARIFQDGMILQRNQPVCVWGTATPGKEITVSIQGQTAGTLSGADGHWEVWLPPLTASRSETMCLCCEEEQLEISDVAVGEVWIAGGQSNMEFPVRFESHWAQEKEGICGELRFYDVGEVCYPGQDSDFDYSAVNRWRKKNPIDLPFFSAVGYYFQKELFQALQVPVGIIGCNWAGTRSCAWMREETIRKVAPAWLEAYDRQMTGIDRAQYWENARHDPANDRGNPNSDPFCNFIMPRTPSAEEIQEFYRTMQMEPVQQDGTPKPETKPGCLFSHMVLPIAPYGVKGVLWYQGESDDQPGLQSLYTAMLSGMIADWRKLWKQQPLPFYIVQLPGWESWLMIHNDDYTTIRRCQQTVTETVPGTYLCSISDAGERLDIHPKDKQVVGHRLALLARKHTYGEDLLSDPPMLESARREGNTISLSFRHAGAGLSVRGDVIQALDVLVHEQPVSFTWKVNGDQLLLELTEQASGPITVAFAQGTWYRVNLYSSAGLPAIPFVWEEPKTE